MRWNTLLSQKIENALSTRTNLRHGEDMVTLPYPHHESDILSEKLHVFGFESRAVFGSALFPRVQELLDIRRVQVIHGHDGHPGIDLLILDWLFLDG